MRLPPHHITFYRRALFLALVTITYLALAPQDFPTVPTVWDKLNHFAAFLALSWLADFACPGRPFGLEKIGALLAYGLLLEIIQAVLPDRQFSLTDIGADLLGIAAYGSLIPLLRITPGLKERWRE